MQQELGLQIMLGTALQAIKGYAAPEVEHTYTCAWNLSLQMEETPQLFPMFVGLQIFYVVRAELPKARQLAEQCLRLAERAQDPVLLVEAHTYLGLSLCFLGELMLAQEHLGHAILLYDAHQHSAYTSVYGHDPGVLAGSVMAWTLWLLGDVDQALQRGQETLTLVRVLAHAHSLAFALWYMIVVYGACRAWEKAETLVKELMVVAPEQGLQYWLALGTYGRGWVGAGQGQYEAGIALMRQGITAYQTSGAQSAMAWMLCGLAEVYGNVGQVDEGLHVLAEMPGQVTPFHEAEFWRVQGELLVQQGHSHVQQAETCFSKALEVARGQQARSLELRAAMSLSRLWQRQGKGAEARQLLAEVYGWFTEGFDTADLQEAGALLEEWA
jgi:predicted ATPase